MVSADPQYRSGEKLSPSRAAPPVVTDAVLVLDDSGTIRHCDEVAEVLFSYRCSELVGQHVSTVLPELKELELIREGRPNPRLRFLSRVGHRFQVVTRHGQRLLSDLFLNCVGNADPALLRLIVRIAASQTMNLEQN